MLLTENFLLMKTRMQSLNHIRRLNAWGQDLDDVSLLSQLDNVEVISLSVNNINTLEPFRGLPHLQELHLRKNVIADLAELDHLRWCPELRVLTLRENPVAYSNIYRELVIALLPQLEKLDDVEITDVEAAQACAVIERRQVECGGDWALLFEREASCMSAHMAEDAEYEAEQRKQEEARQKELLREQRRKSHAGLTEQSPGGADASPFGEPVGRTRSSGDLGPKSPAPPVMSSPAKPTRGSFDVNGPARRTPPAQSRASSSSVSAATPSTGHHAPPRGPLPASPVVQSPEILNSVLNLLSCLDMESLELVKCRTETHIARLREAQQGSSHDLPRRTKSENCSTAGGPQERFTPSSENGGAGGSRLSRQGSNPHLDRESRPAVSRAQLQRLGQEFEEEDPARSFEGGGAKSAPHSNGQHRKVGSGRPVMCL